MDLKETSLSAQRHPWETSRLKITRKILSTFIPKKTGRKILDYGCGDGWIAQNIANADDAVHGIDINITAEELHGKPKTPVTFFNKPEELSKDYDLILLMDVLEHVENDVAILSKLKNEQAPKGSFFLITVPAHQALYSSKDKFLGHYRRYNRKELRKTIQASGLNIIAEGSMFASLILPYAIVYLTEKLSAKDLKEQTLANGWRHGPLVTKTIESFLQLDNMLLFGLNRLKIPVTGLTLWAIAQKP